MPDASTPEAAITKLLSIMARLRDPDGGCPWDLKQTFDTVVPYTVEEAFEVAEAVARRDYPELREELGDLLLQVVFHSQMAREQGLFDFAEVVAVLNEKMVRRHPHVFGEVEAADESAVKVNWEVIKADERARKGREHHSAVDGVPDGLPALQRALKLQKKAAKVGFDWRQTGPVRDQVGLELAELDQALEQGDRDAMEDELGDVFFTLVNLARHLKLDPDLALRRASDKFEGRFRKVETLANRPLADYDEASLDALWRQAKKTP
ncbi:nucleoside triphosphate pyrophosphohydrolase [Alloalcanivorax gelatiniphagus]|uniref:Nucleoside triphosphate pyrophosphohydrolase n=1 Tax=Alloalcanivorax gelatiniphagus TaxID=1194167 RepID=A0ABY2XLU8_9GAMM|nr:nucleoside triphosphate pyrophosphohydrolase [Alloalcanivorax gelatiniphagus]TMW12722.1 nucleoside triphosphate pyrophosphohydrolase [Alloalcanivorax gelatiniphagus]